MRADRPQTGRFLTVIPETVSFRLCRSISAKTGAIKALANLVLLVALGVDFVFAWCFLYFFLHIIPNLDFLISIIPPSLMALLMLGWKRALLVAGGLILTERLGDFVVKPMLRIKGLHVSLLEIMLSLMVWVSFSARQQQSWRSRSCSRYEDSSTGPRRKGSLGWCRCRADLQFVIRLFLPARREFI